MPLSTSLFYDTSTRAMTRLSTRADTLNAQIASGKKLNAPSDDSVAYQRLRRLAQADANDAADATNLTLAATVLQQGDDALKAITDRLQRAQELAISAGSGTQSPAARNAIAIELQSILADVVGLANTNDVRGGALFGGASDGAAVTSAADGSLTFQPGTAAAIPTSNGQSVQTNANAASFLGFAGGDLGTVITNLVSSLQGSGTVDSASAIAGLKTVSDQVTQTRSSLGARGARVELEQSRLADLAVAREDTREGIEGMSTADMAASITELQKTMTILSATQASFAKLSSLSLFDYLR